MNTAERLEKLMGTLGVMRDRALEDKLGFEAEEFWRAHHDARQILAELPGYEKQLEGPWAGFSSARGRVIVEFVKEGKTYEQIADEISTDAAQVKRIAEAQLEPEGPVFEVNKPVTRDEAIDCAASNLAKVDVTRKILTVFEAFPEVLRGVTAEAILVQIRKIVGFEA